MNEKLIILKDHYGTWEKVADAIGITPRQLSRIRKEPKEATLTIKKLVEMLCFQIKVAQFLK